MAPEDLWPQAGAQVALRGPLGAQGAPWGSQGNPWGPRGPKGPSLVMGQCSFLLVLCAQSTDPTAMDTMDTMDTTITMDTMDTMDTMVTMDAT